MSTNIAQHRQNLMGGKQEKKVTQGWVGSEGGEDLGGVGRGRSRESSENSHKIFKQLKNHKDGKTMKLNNSKVSGFFFKVFVFCFEITTLTDL